MLIRITKCSNYFYWYRDYIGSVFSVEYVDKTDGSYWCRELDEYHALNFVKPQDATVVELPNAV